MQAVPGSPVSIDPRATSLPPPGNVLLDLLAGLVADVGVPPLDQLHRQLVQAVKVVGGVGDPVGRPPHPRDDLLDVVDILPLLRLGVGVVEAQEAVAAARRPCQSPRTWPWHARCAGSHWAREESA
ncbi:hypothetical protein F751_1653 [Auxenochlorella protothecoides]|uniref:Uncharacterized protein n=1 Tax=Auxenochlorella protothecoides TaxID=3075 RepID=A0A087SU73_AUXPR|nr:hypothetical protein F751_1653 [Auxenochlorella protothecoides]KFM29277.1 hypothetical protein F751_1653 [Auxenochlorella protothecoides]